MYFWFLIVGGFISFFNAWGIGANDLENNREFQTPDYRHMNERVLTEKQPVFMPDPLVIEKNQRHLP